MHVIKRNLKVVHDKKSTYVDQQREFKEFKVGEEVYFYINSKRISLRMGSCTKLASHYYGPFDIFENIGPLAYQLSFTWTVKVHGLFHVPLLKKYVQDVNHVIESFVL